MKKCRKDIRDIFLSHKGKSIDTLIGKINPVIRGKANYMNKVVSSKAFSILDDYIFRRQVLHVRHTHPTKPTKWTSRKYWGRLNFQRPNNNWVFGSKSTGNYMLKFSWTKINRHSLVRQKSSPDDPQLREYWEKRRKKVDKSEAEKLSKRQEFIAHKQGYKCPKCGQSLFNNEPLHLHHIIPKKNGGKDTKDNLVWLHLYCHHKTHYEKV